MSEVKVNKISPRSGTNVQLGDSGDTITVPSGATLDASNATTTLPANVVTTTGSQTLTNKTIGSSQLTGALPALDGSALTGIPDTIAPTRHSIRPSLNLDFANSKALDPRITFTRASNATYYDGYTSVKAEENLVSYSQEFNSWNTARTTVTANDTTAPDGTTTADAVYDNTENLPHYVYIDSSSFFTTYIYNVSCYVKNNGSDTVVIQLGVSGLNACTFNVSTGVVTGTGGNCSQATITDVGNSWYRCSFQVDTVTANGNRYFVFLKNSSSYVGTGTDGLYLWGFQVEQRDSLTSYTPTTSSPITKYQPALQTAGNNVARFDHNPTTGESLGLLIEESRTNLSTYSEDLISWNDSNTGNTLKANVAIAPDGTLTADRVIKDAAATNNYAGKSFTTTTNTQYVASVYVKKYQSSSTLKYFALTRTSNTANTAWFDLDTGTVGTVRGTNASATITHVGNDWYRVSYTWEEPTTNIVVYHRISSADDTTTVAGNGYDGYLVWGFQLEQGSFPTSYIKTEGSQVTRSADNAFMYNIDQSDWFKQGEGTIYTNLTQLTGADNTIVFYNNDIGINDECLQIKAFATRQFQIRRFGAQLLVDLDNGTPPDNQEYKIGIAYKTDDIALSLDGNTPSTDTSSSIPFVDTIQFSYLNTESHYFKKFSYYPLRLTDNEIQDLSEE